MDIITIASTAIALVLMVIYVRHLFKQIDDARHSLKGAEDALRSAKSTNKYMERHMEIVEKRMQQEIDRLKDVSEDSCKILGIKSIEFTARNPCGDLHKTTFTLGLGTCGKTVEWLKWSRYADTAVLTQYHTDGSLKEFTFKTADILGREIIEKEEMNLRKESRAMLAIKAKHRLPGMA